MLNETGTRGVYRAGSVVYLRCAVVGFDGKTDNKGLPRVALQQITKDGTPDSTSWLYVDEETLIDGRVVVSELEARK